MTKFVVYHAEIATQFQNILSLESVYCPVQSVRLEFVTTR